MSQDFDDNWKCHDSYEPGVSSNRIVTRSQSCFNRIENTPSDVDLFADKTRHKPPGQPHLMSTMKGTYGSIPKTIVTRSTGELLEPTPELIAALRLYKNYKSRKGSISKVKQEPIDATEKKKSARSIKRGKGASSSAPTKSASKKTKSRNKKTSKKKIKTEKED